MADVTTQRLGYLVRSLFEVLMPHPLGLQARDAIEQLQQRVTLTEHEHGTYKNGVRRFDKLVRFGTIGCVKAGWIQKSKGRWSITDAGRAALAKYKDPSDFFRAARKLYAEWRATQPDAESETTEGPEEETAAENVRVTFDAAEEQSWTEIDHYLRSMNPYDFQELIADLLRAMGYHPLYVAPPGKDGGVDVIAWGDPIGAKPPRIKVQVKRRADAVSIDGLREFLSVLGPDDVGIYVAISDFTKDAKDLARGQETRKVTLINLERLFDLWVEHYDRLSDEARRRLPLRPIWFLAPRI